MPICLGGITYSPSQNPDYQFARLFTNAKGLILSSGSKTGAPNCRPDLGLIQLEKISLPGYSGSLNGVSIDEFAVSGTELQVKIGLSPGITGQALRASVPRGQLPEAWWLQWNRSTQDTETPQNQTDGLMLLMTTLGKLMVAPDTTPAAAFCLLTSS